MQALEPGTKQPPYRYRDDARILWEHDAGGALGKLQLELRRFLNSLETHFAVPLDQLRQETLLLLGLSGGPDSLALAAAFARVAIHREAPWHCASLSVDHGWRPESAAEARAAAALAKELGFSQARVYRLGEPGNNAGSKEKESPGPEARARELRWRGLAVTAQDLAREYDCSRAVIVTGHTLDDQAETVLLRLARGASLRSLGAMAAINRIHPETGLAWRNHEADLDGGNQPTKPQPPHPRTLDGEGKPQGGTSRGAVELWVGRPLLGLRHHDTVAACEQAGLVPAWDPTNRVDGPVRTAQGEALPRAALRENVLPALRQALGQDPAEALARLAQQARQDEAALEEWARAALEASWPGKASWKPSQGLILQVTGLGKLPAAVLRRVIRLAGQSAGWDPAAVRQSHLEQVAALVRQWHGQGSAKLPGLEVSRREGYLHFCPVQE